MPDITMCNTIKCKKWNTCYRAQAYPDKYQSVSDFDADTKKKPCEYYWPLETTSIGKTSPMHKTNDK